ITSHEQRSPQPSLQTRQTVNRALNSLARLNFRRLRTQKLLPQNRSALTSALSQLEMSTQSRPLGRPVGLCHNWNVLCRGGSPVTRNDLPESSLVRHFWGRVWASPQLGVAAFCLLG